MDGGAADDEWTLPRSHQPPVAPSSRSLTSTLPLSHYSSVAGPADCSAPDVFLCLGSSHSRLLSVLYRLCAGVATELSAARVQRSTAVPAYIALACQHVQQPVWILTTKPHPNAQQQTDLATKWSSLRAVRGEDEQGWKDVRVQSDSSCAHSAIQLSSAQLALVRC